MKFTLDSFIFPSKVAEPKKKKARDGRKASRAIIVEDEPEVITLRDLCIRTALQLFREFPAFKSYIRYQCVVTLPLEIMSQEWASSEDLLSNVSSFMDSVRKGIQEEAKLRDITHFLLLNLRGFVSKNYPPKEGEETLELVRSQIQDYRNRFWNESSVIKLLINLGRVFVGKEWDDFVKSLGLAEI